jgi:hypothetical protein
MLNSSEIVTLDNISYTATFLPIRLPTTPSAEIGEERQVSK